jgi:hypothetical protein
MEIPRILMNSDCAGLDDADANRKGRARRGDHSITLGIASKPNAGDLKV